MYSTQNIKVHWVAAYEHLDEFIIYLIGIHQDEA